MTTLVFHSAVTGARLGAPDLLHQIRPLVLGDFELIATGGIRPVASMNTGSHMVGDGVIVSKLVDRFGLERLCTLATERDPGFDREIFIQMLGQFSKWLRADFDLTDSEYAQLKQEVEDWRLHLRGLR